MKKRRFVLTLDEDELDFILGAIETAMAANEEADRKRGKRWVMDVLKAEAKTPSELHYERTTLAPTYLKLVQHWRGDRSVSMAHLADRSDFAYFENEGVMPPWNKA